MAQTGSYISKGHCHPAVRTESQVPIAPTLPACAIQDCVMASSHSLTARDMLNQPQPWRGFQSQEFDPFDSSGALEPFQRRQRGPGTTSCLSSMQQCCQGGRSCQDRRVGQFTRGKGRQTACKRHAHLSAFVCEVTHVISFYYLS